MARVVIGDEVARDALTAAAWRASRPTAEWGAEDTPALLELLRLVRIRAERVEWLGRAFVDGPGGSLVVALTRSQFIGASPSGKARVFDRRRAVGAVLRRDGAFVVVRKLGLGIREEVTFRSWPEVRGTLLQDVPVEDVAAGPTASPATRAGRWAAASASSSLRTRSLAFGTTPTPAAPAYAPQPTTPAPAPRPIVSIVTWQIAEGFAAVHLASLGFQGVQRTRAGADGGIDVAGPGVVAQVKHHDRAVGTKYVRELKGVSGNNQAVFYALSGYSKVAVAEATSLGVALFQYDETGSVSAVNAHAKALEGPGGAGSAFEQRLADERAIEARASQLAAKLGSIRVARRLSKRQARSYLDGVAAARANIDEARRSTSLSRRSRDRLLNDAEQLVKNAAGIAGVRYRKL